MDRKGHSVSGASSNFAVSGPGLALLAPAADRNAGAVRALIS
jgi:hypothetical protein